MDGSARHDGNCSERVLRGCSWGDGPGSLRSALRIWHSAGDRDNYVGFRLARTMN